ncbi:O-antigen ligase family protein [Paenibacillus lentus]|uniref:Polymerase n=1 Tax=Paenibacillus lentus TaxID=1338368 RepID=A0A3S8RSJ3_9BACL|nr:O-antigen ligase family protein [Paenibacillus lentus]AZK45966.1 polymerase [Paenibacillus lentus]
MSNQVYGKKAAASRNGNKLSVANWLLMFGIVILMIWAPFQAGLFNGLLLQFDRPIFWSVIIGSVLLLIWLAAYYKKIKLEDQRDWTAVFVILLPITYLISLISAASHYFAMNMLFIQCLYAIMFIIGLYLMQNKQANRFVETTTITAAYIIVMFGLLNWLGQGRTASAIVGWFSGTVYEGQYHQAVWIDANGPRLASVFQYPNTYAAFLMAFFFVAVFAITRSSKWYVQAIHAFMLVPMALSILLTLSRGGLVFLPIVFIVLLLFLKPAKQLLWILYCLIAGIGTLLIAKPVTNLGQQFHQGLINDPAKGWGYVLIVSVIVAALAWVIQRFLAPKLEQRLGGLSERKLSNLWLPVSSVVAVVILAAVFLGTNAKHILPGNIGERLENINFQQHSVLERLTFYKDAVKVMKDYPVIGAGGGAWASLYEKYQNNPYLSRQAHSFVMQYLVEVGILGFVVFLAFILFIFYKYIKSYIRSSEERRESYFIYFILVFSLLIHSMMDFNMSYVYIGILVFLGLAGMSAAMDNKPVKRLALKASTARGLYGAVTVVASLILIFTSIRYIQANDEVSRGRELMSTSTNFQEIKAPLERALQKRANQPDAVLNLHVLMKAGYEQTQDESFYNESYKLLTNALKKEPFNKSIYNQLMALHQLKGESEQVYAILRDNADKYAWDMNWYDQLISQSYELGYQALGQGAIAEKEKYFKTGLDAYAHVSAGVEHLKTLPPGQFQGGEFYITPQMTLSAGKMQFMMNEPEQAAIILKNGLTEDLNDTTMRDIAVWYLAALQKSGASDQPVYDQLIQIAPAEKDTIDQLAKLQF